MKTPTRLNWTGPQRHNNKEHSARHVDDGPHQMYLKRRSHFYQCSGAPVLSAPRKITYFDRAIHLWTSVAEVEKCHNGQPYGQPVDEGDVVNEGIHVRGTQVHQREQTLKNTGSSNVCKVQMFRALPVQPWKMQKKGFLFIFQ